MKRKSNACTVRWVTFALTALFAAQAQAQVEVTVRQDLKPINVLNKGTYGSGFAYQNADIRVMFTNRSYSGNSVAAQKSYDMLKSLNLGTFRFPSGDPSFLYRWDKPCGSVAAPQPQCAEYLSPEDVTKYFTSGTVNSGQAPLGGQVMFQINTVQSWVENSGQIIWKTVYQKDEWFDEPTQQWMSRPNKDTNGRYKIDEEGLQQAAKVAANWVRSNRKLPKNQQTVYWEIGNEDWVRWTAQQYAQIFAVVAAEMLKENKGGVKGSDTHAELRLIAQTTTLSKDYRELPSSKASENNLAINQTAGAQFATIFAGELKSNGFGFSPKDAYGVALHPYLTGDRNPSIATRTLNMFKKIDSANSEVQQTLNALAAINKNFGTNWQTLVTEYNVLEGIEPDTNNNPIPAQNKAHALILTDWTAKMLAQGVEKVLPHNIEADPRMGLFLYRNGYTISEPRLMAPGAAFGRLSNALQGTLYLAENNAKNFVGNEANLKSLSSYAAVSSSGKSLNVLLVNRNLYQSQNVTLKFKGPKKFKDKGVLSSSIYGETNTLADDNFTSNVIWNKPVTSSYSQNCSNGWLSPRTCTLIPKTAISVPAGGMIHLEMPLE